jgi:hypothetical protein
MGNSRKVARSRIQPEADAEIIREQSGVPGVEKPGRAHHPPDRLFKPGQDGAGKEGKLPS